MHMINEYEKYNFCLFVLGQYLIETHWETKF